MPNSSDNVTAMLCDWSNGDRQALERLMPVVYDELRRQAARYLRRERPNHTLQPTALIHEAYLRLIDQRNVRWQNRAHFFGVAAKMMRRILVDHARQTQRGKRGGGDVKLPLEEAMIVATEPKDVNLIALDEALERLGVKDKQQSRVVELKYFGGLSIEETAEVLGVSPATVKRDWDVAKAWLHREITAS